MKWVEIISLRCPGNIDTRSIDELLKGAGECDLPTDTPNHLMDIKIYHHSVVETDLSIHIYWRSERRKARCALCFRIISGKEGGGDDLFDGGARNPVVLVSPLRMIYRRYPLGG